MSVSSTVRKAGPYTGNGSTSQFPFSFKVFQASEVVVVRTDPLGAESVLALTTDYTVALNADQDANPGGTVTAVTAPATGYLITLTSQVQNLQPVTLTNQGAFYPKVINDALDRVTILAQQVAEQVGRAVKVQISSPVTPDALIAQLTSDASAAASSASSASASQSAAATSATNSAASASAAAGSASAASTQASNAATSASNSAASATAASTSATAAANSATAASASQSAAATSATNSAASASAAAGSAALAQQYVTGITPSMPLGKADAITPCLIKTGSGAIAIKAGTTAYLSSGSVSFAAQTAVSMPTLTAGTDYSVWVKSDGTAVAVADPFSSPASPPATGALKIGGFHYGLVAPGTTVAAGSFNAATSSPLVSMVWAQSDVDAIAGINQWSIWDLRFRPLSDPRGMVCVTDAKGRGAFWFDIYFCGTQHITNGSSAYNSDVASGTVLPVIPLMFGGNGTTKYSTFMWYEAAEVAFSHKKRLMSYQEFSAAAFGVTENQSLGGASSTIPATARQAGYTSKWGGEQVSGHHWTWGNVAHGVGGSAWVSGPARGQSYGTPYGALFGGNRDSAGSSGSRCSYWLNAPWNSSWSTGLRAACDHLSL